MVLKFIGFLGLGLIGGQGAFTARARPNRRESRRATAIIVRKFGRICCEMAPLLAGAVLMTEIARATSGKAFALPSDTSLANVPLLEPPLVEVGRSKDQPLWDRWYWLLTLVVVVGLGWGLRRRFGYV